MTRDQDFLVLTTCLAVEIAFCVLPCFALFRYLSFKLLGCYDFNFGSLLCLLLVESLGL